MKRINNNWEFVPEWSEAFLNGEKHGETVRIPHTVKELPLHSIDPQDYQMICGYRREIELTEEEAAKKVFVQFDAAAHIAQVFCNGRKITEHRSGYTAFRCDVSGCVHAGKNTIAVRLDTTENAQIPPFGNVVDYLTYGGIYRDVWLDIRNETYIEDVFAETPDHETLRVHVWTAGDTAGRKLIFTVLDQDEIKAQKTFDLSGEMYTMHVPGAQDGKFWTVMSIRCVRN